MGPFINSWEEDHLSTYLRPKQWRDLVKLVPLDMVTNMEAKMGDILRLQNSENFSNGRGGDVLNWCSTSTEFCFWVEGSSLFLLASFHWVAASYKGITRRRGLCEPAALHITQQGEVINCLLIGMYVWNLSLEERSWFNDSTNFNQGRKNIWKEYLASKCNKAFFTSVN